MKAAPRQDKNTLSDDWSLAFNVHSPNPALYIYNIPGYHIKSIIAKKPEDDSIAWLQRDLAKNFTKDLRINQYFWITQRMLE